MLIAISGSQGSGKSTILKELRESGFHTIERKTARSVLQDWNMTLDEINKDKNLKIQFQDAVLDRKYSDEISARDSLYEDEHLAQIFVERSFVDVFAYTLVSLGKYNEYSDWLNSYYSTCLSYQQRYDKVFYLRGGLFPVEHDGTRGSNKHYSRMVDVTMLEYTKQMTHPSKLSIIDVGDLDQRLDLITHQS